MSAALLLITDRRFDYFDRTVKSIGENLPDFKHVIVVDDSSHRLGFAGAIQEGWDRVLDTDATWVFHAEDDFTYHQPVPVDQMIALLDQQPHLAQVALKRQPWNDREKEAGGIVEADPDDFTSCASDTATWTEHRRFFTTNPSVYPARLCRLGWPQEPHSEGVFTHRLLADPLLRFAFWGAKHDPPLVEHIGKVRTGVGY